MVSVPSGSNSMAWFGRGRRKSRRSCSGGRTSTIWWAAAPRPLRRRHLAPADVQELVGHVAGRLAVEDLAGDRVRPVARAARGCQVLAARLDRHAEERPLGGPLQVPWQLGGALERRDPSRRARSPPPTSRSRAGIRRRPWRRPSHVASVVPIRPQVGQIDLIGSQPAGRSTFADAPVEVAHHLRPVQGHRMNGSIRPVG